MTNFIDSLTQTWRGRIALAFIPILVALPNILFTDRYASSSRIIYLIVVALVSFAVISVIASNVNLPYWLMTKILRGGSPAALGVGGSPAALLPITITVPAILGSDPGVRPKPSLDLAPSLAAWGQYRECVYRTPYNPPETSKKHSRLFGNARL